MDELGEVLEQILKWSKAAAIIGGIVLAILAFDRWSASPKVDAAKDGVQQPADDGQAKPSAATYPEQTTADDLNRQREAQMAIQQAETAASEAQAAAQAQSASAQAHFEPAPEFQPSPAVYTGNICASASEPQKDMPAQKKHRWPRRFLGAIGHGFKAIGRGIGKVGKTIVGR
jgi:hypothetical protein